MPELLWLLLAYKMTHLGSYLMPYRSVRFSVGCGLWRGNVVKCSGSQGCIASPIPNADTFET